MPYRFARKIGRQDHHTEVSRVRALYFNIQNGSLPVILAALLLSWYPTSWAEQQPLILGIFPRHSPSQTVQMYHPLAQHLSQQLGREVKVETTPSYAQFWQALQNAHYHIAHMNQYQYVRAHKENGYRAVAKNEEAGRDTIAGAIVVRKDSGITSIEALRGKTIVFGGDRSALMSYIIPTYLLRQAGLKEGEYKEIFSTAPPNVALTVYFRHANAGGTSDLVLEMPFVRDKIDASQLEYILRGEAVAQLPWAVRRDITDAETAEIRRALLSVKESENREHILTTASLTNILPAEDSEYNAVRKIVRTVTDEQF